MAPSPRSARVDRSVYVLRFGRKRAGEPSESKKSPPSMNTRNPREITMSETSITLQRASIRSLSSLSYLSPLYPLFLPSIRYPIPTQEAGNAMVTPPKSRMPMDNGDHLYSGGSQARLPLDNLVKFANNLGKQRLSATMGLPALCPRTPAPPEPLSRESPDN
ncbi:hypothetical protein EVAR_28248_1 [Eumeta japonica]|uniref:Uncharacterized protein n=1 Tax=Eumeta variegata TaxID=151549 RepID=A0A4C1V7X4_EUMVA|nr:hypothetical protein EVAR_28248_1 [Eumeta japonica]